jgi:glycosyltransferase involved in cell wall biosynthesis
VPVAIVHDFLSQFGGAERVVLRLAALFPGAPIFTAFYAPDETYEEFRDLPVYTSELQGHIRPEGFRRSVLRYPAAFRHFDLERAERIVVSSSTFAHHVRHPRSLVYCYTPPRFLTEPQAYIGNPGLASAFKVASLPLRRRDRSAARRHRRYLACSEVVAERIHHRYGLDAPVVYPPLSTGHLPVRITGAPSRPRALVVARLVSYKRVDVAIAACARACVPLTVVGEGPDEPRLRALAGADVSFRGRVADSELASLFASHSVVLAPGREDFGYAPIEANWSGRPAVALAEGGARETVVDGLTGRLVDGWSVDAWSAAVTDAVNRRWSSTALRRYAERFSGEAFDGAILGHLSALG